MQVELADVEKVFHYKNMAYTEEELKKELEQQEYQYGFTTKIESETFPIGLNKDIVRKISKKKNEPEWMTDWRLSAFEAWEKMEEPDWSNVKYKKPDFQSISYYSAPKTGAKYDSLDEVDPELLKTFDKLGISIDEQKNFLVLRLTSLWILSLLLQLLKKLCPKKVLFFVQFLKQFKIIRI
jgi:Fe-S cluster assembly protein SufB